MTSKTNWRRNRWTLPHKFGWSFFPMPINPTSFCLRHRLDDRLWRQQTRRESVIDAHHTLVKGSRGMMMMTVVAMNNLVVFFLATLFFIEAAQQSIQEPVSTLNGLHCHGGRGVMVHNPPYHLLLRHLVFKGWAHPCQLLIIKCIMTVLACGRPSASKCRSVSLGHLVRPHAYVMSFCPYRMPSHLQSLCGLLCVVCACCVCPKSNRMFLTERW